MSIANLPNTTNLDNLDINCGTLNGETLNGENINCQNLNAATMTIGSVTVNQLEVDSLFIAVDPALDNSLTDFLVRDPADGSVKKNQSVVRLTAAQTLTNKTLTNPVIANINNGQNIAVPAGISSIFALQSAAPQTTDNVATYFNSSPNPAVLQDSGIAASSLVTLTGAQTLTNKTLTTPDLGTPSALVLTNATGDQVGVNNGSDAQVAHVGEYVNQQTLIADEQAMTSGVAQNVIFPFVLAFGPGDWDIYGTVVFHPNAATTSSSFIAALSSTSATLPTLGVDNNTHRIDGTFSAGQTCVLNVGPVRSSSAFIQTIFLVAQSTFAVNTMSVYGCLTARRVR